MDIPEQATTVEDLAAAIGHAVYRDLVGGPVGWERFPLDELAAAIEDQVRFAVDRALEDMESGAIAY